MVRSLVRSLMTRLRRFRAPGARAERAASRWLRRRGHRILARNLRAGRGEIDLVTREGEVLVFVEIRYRAAGLLAAELSVDRKKTRRFAEAVAFWRRRGALREVRWRGDLILVAPRGRGFVFSWRRGVLP
ncbi:MAG: YraN family protein [Planctomycetota bacterium]